jgi:tetratricopeptide (TPR) repeat protein
VTSRLTLALVALLGLGYPFVSTAQSTTENAEARVYFQEGNRLYQEANVAEDAQRTSLLRRSLEAYVDSLRIVRSRNALFNAAIVLGELGRYDESFNYFSEYLRIEGLPAADLEDASNRRDALRARVAVLRVTTEPEGALVWIDRKDLAPRGETPIELGLPAGEHRIYIEKSGYAPVERSTAIALGETIVLDVPLSALPAEPPKPESAPEPVQQPEAVPRSRLRTAAIGTAASTLAAAGVGLGLSLRARSLNNEYRDAAAQWRLTGNRADLERARHLADRTDRFNLTADVFWATTIALGVSAIVLYGLHRKRQKRESPQIAVSASKDGGFASVRIPVGVSR